MPRFLSSATLLIFTGAFIGHLAACVTAAAATEITIPVRDADTVERRTVNYTCGERRISADYLNAGAVALALLHGDSGEVTVMANVTAASGAKYVGGAYTWWTKGEAATLYDLRNGENTTGIECRAMR